MTAAKIDQAGRGLWPTVEDGRVGAAKPELPRQLAQRAKGACPVTPASVSSRPCTDKSSGQSLHEGAEVTDKVFGSVKGDLVEQHRRASQTEVSADGKEEV